MKALRDTVTHLLEQSGCHYSIDSDGDIVILLGRPDGQVEPYHIVFPDGNSLIHLVHVYLPVPRSRAAEVALVMADLNAKYRFGTLCLRDGLALADLSVLCENVADLDSHIGTHFGLFLDTVRKTSDSVRQAALRRRTRPTRLERDIAEALRSADSAAS